MLDQEQREAFARTGILRLPGAVPAAATVRMGDVIWRELERRHGIVRADRSTWDRHPPTGLKGSKRSRVFDAIGSPAVRSALDGLFGPGEWAEPRTWGGQVLVTMPSAEAWRVPHRIWHSDFPATLSTDDLTVVKVWTLVDDVEPGGGGTPHLAGSHRAFARYLETGVDREHKAAKHGFLRSHPWLRALCADDGSADRTARFMGGEADLDGLPVRVVELCGAAGDVFVTHGWVFHSIAVNASTRPRMMRSTAVFRRAAPVGGGEADAPRRG